ncbi:MFS transporter [Campylobacterota bacterium DY0563]
MLYNKFQNTVTIIIQCFSISKYLQKPSLSSLFLFFSSSLESLYLLRSTQAFFGGMATVNAAAIVRDLFHGKEAAKIFSTIASITMIAPMSAPAIGSLIVSYFTWQYIFLFLSIYSFFAFFLIYFKLPETGTKSKTSIKEAYKKVLTHKKSIAYILSVSFALSGMFIFIGKSSFIYMEYFNISKNIFPFLFGSNVLMMIILTKVNIKLIQKTNPKDILKIGILLQIISSFALVIFSYNPPIHLIFILMVIYIGSLGFIFGNAMALALDFFKKDSGVANSVIGVTEFLIAGFVGFLSSLIDNNSLTSIFLLMCITAFLSFFSL